MARSLLTLPFNYTIRMIDCVKTAEEKLGKPPTVVEIFVEMKSRYPWMPVASIFEGAAFLVSLFREDMIFADASCEHYTALRQDGFFSFTELFRKRIGD